MELATLNLDTYKIVKHLRDKGFSKEQAEGFIEAVQEITLSGVATKQDLANLSEKLLRFMFANTVAIIGIMVAIQFIPAG